MSRPPWSVSVSEEVSVDMTGNLCARHRRQRRVQLDRLALALQVHAVARREAAVGEREQAARRLGQQDRVAGLTRGLLDARGRVDRVADDRELDVPAAADGA